MTRAAIPQAPATCWRPLHGTSGERAMTSFARQTPVEPMTRSLRSQARGTGRPQRADVMLLELQSYIERGYWRVAVRRFLMMQAQGMDVPSSEAQRCTEFIRRCSDAELAAISRRVTEWARIVGLDDKGSSAS